jgi:hypothetical protein
MEAKVSSPHSQTPDTCPYHEPDCQSTPSTIYFFKVDFNIVLPSTLWSWKCSLSFWLLHVNSIRTHCVKSDSSCPSPPTPLYLFHPFVVPVTSHTVFWAWRRHHTSVFPFTVVQQISAEPISVNLLLCFLTIAVVCGDTRNCVLRNRAMCSSLLFWCFVVNFSWERIVARKLSAWENFVTRQLSAWENIVTRQLSAWENIVTRQLSAWENIVARQLSAWESIVARQLSAWESIVARQLSAWESIVARQLSACESIVARQLSAWKSIVARQLSAWDSIVAQQLSAWKIIVVRQLSAWESIGLYLSAQYSK